MVQLIHMAKSQRGGRIVGTATFRTACLARSSEYHADWRIHKTLQSGNSAVNGFSHVGLANLYETPVIVKLMTNELKARREIAAAEFFRLHPHVNVVQGFCEYKCNDHEIRWKKDVILPKRFCKASLKRGNRSDRFTVIVQEYIPGGDLQGVTWNKRVWKSVFLQLTFAVIEWWSQGFVYEDWHLGNVLHDKTDGEERSHTYSALGRQWKVNLHGIIPVITDFSISKLAANDNISPSDLALSLGEVWYMLYDEGPDAYKTVLTVAYNEVSKMKNVTEILNMVDKTVATLAS